MYKKTTPETNYVLKYSTLKSRDGYRAEHEYAPWKYIKSENDDHEDEDVNGQQHSVRKYCYKITVFLNTL